MNITTAVKADFLKALPCVMRPKPGSGWGLSAQKNFTKNGVAVIFSKIKARFYFLPFTVMQPENAFPPNQDLTKLRTSKENCE